ncbi:MAG: hypothetical protein K6L80_06020 [Agarilytica sp.]
MEWWKKQTEIIDTKPIRERGIIALLILAVVWSGFNFAFLMPLDKEKAKLKVRMDDAEQALKNLSAQEVVLAKALTNDPNAVKKKEIDQLEKKLINLEENLQTLSAGLIPAGALPEALHDVLQNVGSLKLLGMQTLAPSKLQLVRAETASADSNDENSNDENNELREDDVDNVGVFKHSVVVALEGKYFDVVSYLSALESLPWKFYWESIDYEVNQYPKARVLIEVYTLSTDEGVLGV